MSLINNYQSISHLYHENIPRAMIKILQDQRVSDADIRIMNRDDIEHLFRNESGFTFGDRKRLWIAIHKFQSIDTETDIIDLESEDKYYDIHCISDEEDRNYQVTHDSIPSTTSSILTTGEMYNFPYPLVEGNLIELSSTIEEDDDNDNNVKIATTSLPVLIPPVQCRRSKISANIVFVYPVELPKLSPEVTKALEENKSEIVWDALITEVSQWIFTIKKTPLPRQEYIAIGKTLFKKYPGTGRDGFRPWSYLCKCLTQKLRLDRRKSNFIKLMIENS